MSPDRIADRAYRGATRRRRHDQRGRRLPGRLLFGSNLCRQQRRRYAQQNDRGYAARGHDSEHECRNETRPVLLFGGMTLPSGCHLILKAILSWYEGADG